MRNLKFLGMSFLLAMTAATSGVAQNPIIQTKYTADPAPMVYNDTVFLYTTHDEDLYFHRYGELDRSWSCRFSEEF